MPGSLLSRYSPVPGVSVPSCCVTRYCSGESLAMASWSLLNSFISFSSLVLSLMVRDHQLLLRRIDDEHGEQPRRLGVTGVGPECPQRRVHGQLGFLAAALRVAAYHLARRRVNAFPVFTGIQPLATNPVHGCSDTRFLPIQQFRFLDCCHRNSLLSGFRLRNAKHRFEDRLLKSTACHFRVHSQSAATRMASAGKNLKDLLHIAVGGGGGLLRTAPLLTRAQVGRVPVRPVVLAVRLLEVAVVLLRLAEELCKGCDVHVSFPFATSKPCRDLLEQPAVPVRVLERGKREVGTTLRVASGDTRVLHSVVEWAAGIVEDLAHIDAAGYEVVAGGLDVVHGEDQAVCRAGLGRRDSLAEDDRGF